MQFHIQNFKVHTYLHVYYQTLHRGLCSLFSIACTTYTI